MERYSTNVKRYPLEKFLEILNFFSRFEFTEKGEVLPNFGWSRDVTRRINIIRSLFLRNRFRVSKNFFVGYLIVFVEYLCNSSSKMRQKLHFDFSCCKLPE